MLQLFCAAINFAVIWIYLISLSPFFGFVLGWMPAVLGSAIGFIFCFPVIYFLN